MQSLSLLRELVETESPTYSEGVRHVADRIAEELAALEADCRMLEGDHLLAEFDGDGDPLLLVGHTDTVWPEGTLARMPFRIDRDRANGPGTYDMKAGLVVLLDALHRRRRRRTIRVFLTADEEKGSLTARRHLECAAQGVAAAYVLEPPSVSGNPITGRQGVGRFRLSIVGRPSHAGLAPEEGVSAIEELAYQVLRLHALSGNGVLVNVGVVAGGTTENVIAAEAEARIDVRVTSEQDIARIDVALAALTPSLEGTSLSLEGSWTRPPLLRTPGAAQLFERLRACATELGLELHEESVGGGSDANLLAPLGVPVLDGLGPTGHGAHATDEHVLLNSIPIRAQLLAQMLDDPES